MTGRFPMALVALTLTAAACSLATDTEAGPDFDLVGALEERGADVERVGTASSEPFDALANVLRVGDDVIQGFQYGSVDEAVRVAAGFSDDGATAVRPDGAWSIAWVGPPHLFLRGRWIAAYVGSEATILELLRDLMGPQFAGEPY